jgi:MerR HTH family regulatory protein
MGKRPAAASSPGVASVTAKTPVEEEGEREPSAGLRARLEQANLLKQPRARAIWPRLDARQQRLVLDPGKHEDVDHRYPLTSRDLAQLTGLSQRQVRYWADHGLLPHWTKGRRRLFESVGLLTAFAIANARQHEIQLYRLFAQEPVEVLSERLGILASLIASRIDDMRDPAEVKLLADSVEALNEALRPES